MKIYALVSLDVGILVLITGGRSLYLSNLSGTYVVTDGDICRIVLTQGEDPIVGELTNSLEGSKEKYIEIDYTELEYPALANAKALRDWLIDNSVTSMGSVSVTGRVALADNDLGMDAWGRPKTIQDFSLFSALWTFSVPNRVWLQYNNTGSGFAEQLVIDNNLVKSTNGHLQVTGTAATDVSLVSKRHPRYQPNRGLLYSTAVVLPNPTYVGKRQFGLLSTESGVFFELLGDGSDYTLNIIKRTTVQGSTSDVTVDITSFLPSGFDISKGHVYDIQMEWRGVGNFMIFVDLVLVYTFNLLGTLTGMSISNPALHVGWRCLDAGTEDILMIAGCVDVTSEGGSKQNKLYTAVNTGVAMLPTTSGGKAMLAVKLPVLIPYGGNSVRYTRDLILTELNTFCKDEAFRSVLFSRLLKTPNLDGLAGWANANDSEYMYIDNTDGTLDTAFQLDKANMKVIYATRNEKDFSSSHNNPDPDHADFYLVGGDIIVVELKSDGNSTGGCTLEFAEEV